MENFLLVREQWIPRPLGEVFAFFSDARNLGAITPPWLDFRILTPAAPPLCEGTHLRYRIRWHGVPFGWLTEIQSWSPPTEFIDVQLRGPYRVWHHTHHFFPFAGGTRVHDVVRYALPWGPLGWFAHSWLVRSDLEAIFDYRAAKVAELLGDGGGHG